MQVPFCAAPLSARVGHWPGRPRAPLGVRGYFERGHAARGAPLAAGRRGLSTLC